MDRKQFTYRLLDSFQQVKHSYVSTINLQSLWGTIFNKRLHVFLYVLLLFQIGCSVTKEKMEDTLEPNNTSSQSEQTSPAEQTTEIKQSKEYSRVPVGPECDDNPQCDNTTGCLAQSAPHPNRIMQETTNKEQSRLNREFLACRQQAITELVNTRSAIISNQILNLNNNEKQSFSNKISEWNGDIFWAPASKTTNKINRFGDEVRAVMGPIPDTDCSLNSARTLTLEVDGNTVDLKPNPEKPGNPLEFEHRDMDGNFVKWTQDIPKCDKPSLAGGVTFCGMNSRLGIKKIGNVSWTILCRKSKDLELKVDAFWRSDNPEFNLLGYYGYNEETGEVAFFDGEQGNTFTYDKSYRPPGGSGYNDEAGRNEAEITYDSDFSTPCESCHDNKSPWTITPYVKQARVGYRDSERAEKLSLGELLPELLLFKDSPYRIIGSSFTVAAVNGPRRGGIITGKTLEDPSSNCTSCHLLTTLRTGLGFAVDSVVRLNSGEEDHRTLWGQRQGAGKIHPWMTIDGNILSGDPPPEEISEDDWNLLLDCINESGDPDECNYTRIYTECPAPESKEEDDNTRLADPSAPEQLDLIIEDNSDSDNSNFAKKINVVWQYINNLGNVPERDDVRFHVAIKEIDIPENATNPDNSEYPTIEQSIGTEALPLNSSVYYDETNDVTIIKNISYSDHLKWTDPSPTDQLRDYKVEFPAKCNKRYLISLVAKRFCFDQTGDTSEIFESIESKVKYSDKNHTKFKDVNCNSEN